MKQVSAGVSPADVDEPNPVIVREQAPIPIWGERCIVMPILQDQFLDTAQAAHYLGYSKSTLEWWRGEGIGPDHYKTGRRVRYKKSDLDAYIEAGRVQTRVA